MYPAHIYNNCRLFTNHSTFVEETATTTTSAQIDISENCGHNRAHTITP